MKFCLYLGLKMVTQTIKNLPAMKKTLVQSLGQRRKWKPTPVFLPGEFHGQSLAGYSPWGRKELDTTEQITHNTTTR